MSTVDSPVAEGNGRAELDPDAAILEPLQAKLAVLEARRAELQSALDEIAPEMRRYEKALMALRGERLNGHSGPPPGRPGKTVKAYGKTIGAQRMAEIERAIRELAADRDTFSQVDVRGRVNVSSSVTATAFKLLRERNVIRLVGQKGNLKQFRLTREALRAQAES